MVLKTNATDATTLASKPKPNKQNPGHVPTTSDAFENLPTPISPLPPLEICFKCVRCYNNIKQFPFRKFSILWALVLIVEGVARAGFNLYEATYEGKLAYPLSSTTKLDTVLVDQLFLGLLPRLEFQDAVWEPFITVVGATVELLVYEACGGNGYPFAWRVCLDQYLTSQRVLYYAGLPEKALLDIVPGAILLVLAVLDLKRGLGRLLALILTVLLAIGVLAAVGQFCVALGLTLRILAAPAPLNYENMKETCSTVAFQTNPVAVLVCQETFANFTWAMVAPVIWVVLAIKIHSLKCAFTLFKSLSTGNVAPMNVVQPEVGEHGQDHQSDVRPAAVHTVETEKALETTTAPLHTEGLEEEGTTRKSMSPVKSKSKMSKKKKSKKTKKKKGKKKKSIQSE